MSHIIRKKRFNQSKSVAATFYPTATAIIGANSENKLKQLFPINRDYPTPSKTQYVPLGLKALNKEKSSAILPCPVIIVLFYCCTVSDIAATLLRIIC